MDEVIAYYAKDYSKISSSLTRRPSNGIDLNELKEIGLSQEYLNFLNHYKIEDFQIGGVFNLEAKRFQHVNLMGRMKGYFLPRKSLSRQMKDYFLQRNTPLSPDNENYGLSFLTNIKNHKPGFIEVSGFDGGSIMLKQGHHMHNESNVYMWEVGSGWNEPITKIADSYEKFILMNASWDYLYIEDDDKHEAIRYQILDKINPGLSNQGRELWRWLM